MPGDRERVASSLSPMDVTLQQHADDFCDWLIKKSPTFGHLIGDYRYIDQIEDLTRQVEDDSIAELERLTEAVEALDPDALSATDTITRRVLLHEIDAAATPLFTRMAEINVDPTMGVQAKLLQAVGSLRLAEAAHAEAMLVKWTKVHGLFQQAVQRLKQGVARERTPVHGPTEAVVAQIDTYLASPIDQDPFVTMTAPPGFSEPQTADWRSQLASTVEKHVRPGFQAYRDALVNDVLAHTRPDERPGLCWLDDGPDAYERHIRWHTTVELPALAIHETGLEVIRQLAEEYVVLGSAALGTSDLSKIFDRMRSDSTLYFSTSEEVVEVARAAMDRATRLAPEWFGRLPSAPCVVEEVPPSVAKETPAGYYFPPATDGSRPATYFVNSSGPRTRPRYGAEALAFHEAMPGHHLQVALAQEREQNHPFRQHAYITAFDEGWGLYAERLANEMGLYSDDVARLGMLAADSLRAGRLVVDTGLHALGWSRQQAVEYLVENTPVPVAEIVVEVDRYIGSPGQALGYMVGRREIEARRREAESQLGDQFDIGAFHDTVIGSGPLPLPVLKDVVDAWIDSHGQTDEWT